jgi:predicted permease
MLNPIVLSILIGLALALLRIDTVVPKLGMDVVMGFLTMLGAASFPLGILMFGVTLSDVMQTPAWYRDWKTPVGGIVLRLLLLPAMMLVIGKWLSPGAEFDRVLAVQAAMPAAVFPLLMARSYGGDENTAAKVIVFTTIASLLTIPLVLPIAQWWLAR